MSSSAQWSRSLFYTLPAVMSHFALLAVLLLLVACMIVAKDVNLELGSSAIKVNMKELKTRPPYTPTAYCVAEEQLPAPAAVSLLYQPLLYFWKTTIKVEANFPLQWHAVRGLSSDDFYSNIRDTALKYLFRLDDEESRRIIQKREKIEGFGFIRDMLSSCPSPFSSKSPKEPTTCVMHFSSIGKPCVYLNMDGDAVLKSNIGVKRPEITIQAESTFNANGLIRLVCGLLLLQLCNELSKSKTVQYLTGMISFIFLGILIITLKLASRAMQFKKDNKKWQWALFFSGTYAAGAIYFIKLYIQEALIEYWEFTVGYLAIMSLLGVSFVYYMRSRDDRKHVYRVASKNLTRIVAMILLYNGSSSPLASMLTIMFSIVGYMRYSLLKRGIKKNASVEHLASLAEH